MDVFIQKLTGKKHIIWDWNGTLLNDVDHCINAMQRLLQEYKLPPLSREQYRDIFEFPVINYYKTLGFDFDQYPFVEVAHKFVDYYMDGSDHCVLHPGALQILKDVRKLFPCQTILSATDQNSLNSMIKLFQIAPYFDHWYGISDKLASGKIERGLELMQITNYPVHETILIGDTDHDYEVGKSLGIDVLLISHGHHSHERLLQTHPQQNVISSFQY